MCEHSEKKKKNLLFWTKLCSLSVWMRVRNLRTKWGMTFCSCWGNKNSELFSEIPVFFFQMFQSRWGAGVFSLVLHCVHAKSLQLCLTLCNPMDSTLPGSYVHGIDQTRIPWGALKWCFGDLEGWLWRGQRQEALQLVAPLWGKKSVISLCVDGGSVWWSHQSCVHTSGAGGEDGTRKGFLTGWQGLCWECHSLILQHPCHRQLPGLLRILPGRHEKCPLSSLLG